MSLVENLFSLVSGEFGIQLPQGNNTIVGRIYNGPKLSTHLLN